jgi:nitric oxide reductase subunit B
LFGVYGMLGIGLTLFCLRAMNPQAVWNERVMKWSFWWINIGLAAMVLLSLLPIGIAQTVASIDVGMWYARSAEFMQQPYLQTLRWMRGIGDSVFAVGIVAMAVFVLRQRCGGGGHLRTHEAATTPASRRLAETEVTTLN